MSLKNWSQSPRHLLVIFLAIVLLPSALLAVSGWRLMIREETLAVQERQTQMADLVVDDLRRRVDRVDGQLRDPRGDFTDFSGREDFVFVVFSGDRAVTTPARRLLYYPFTAAARELPAAALADAQQLHRAGDIDGALLAWARVARTEGASVTGLPVDLFARWWECELLEEAGRGPELKGRAAALYADLHAGGWQLDRQTFETQVELVSRWMDVPLPTPAVANARTLSAAVERLWQQWRDRPIPDAGLSGHERVSLEGRDLTLFWYADPKRLTALVVGTALIETEWLSSLQNTAARQQLRVALPYPTASVPSRNEMRRASDETRLPWTVAVTSVPSPGTGIGIERLRIWIAGVGVLSLIVVGGAIVIARATARELAVARLQSDFVAAVSHEFRTPLTSLRQIGEVLHDGRIQSDERRRTYYEALTRQTERLHHLVETLLDFGRMEAGRSPYQTVPLDLSSWARSVVEQFSRDVAGRGYTVEFTSGSEPLDVLGDPQALGNALWNLLDNAVKYSPDCRTVWVAVERIGHTAAVRVRDRGIGVPAAEQREIFGKFVRGAEAKRHNISGTGIGLAMVEHIIKAHGGRVRVESQPGLGSTFSLEIPCQES